MAQDDRYVLKTGAEGAYRLQVLNAVHGSDTENLLQRIGLHPGFRVADIGCGIGTISIWLAQQVTPSGSVVGVDASPKQIEQAQLNAQQQQLNNIQFVEASAYQTGLADNSFDLVYCRFVLMHLQDPLRALREMYRLVKPGGVLVCEESDFHSPFCVPPHPAFDRCFELYRAIGTVRGHHFNIGSTLYRMFLELGLSHPNINLVQPIFAQGEAKRLPEWTLAEIGPELLTANLTTAQEIEHLIADMDRLAEDSSVLFGMARMLQIWARKIR